MDRIRPALAAFSGCLYEGALRPEEAVVLRLADCDLPRHGWGADPDPGPGRTAKA